MEFYLTYSFFDKIVTEMNWFLLFATFIQQIEFC